MPDVLTPARRRLVVTIGLVVAVVAVVALTVAVVHRPSSQPPPQQDALPPVVIVPGYGGNTTGLSVLVAALEKDGRSTKVVELGAASVDDLNLQAGMVDDAVEDALAESGGTKVDIVSFSAGGIAVRLWMDAHDGASTARRVVTLSAPNHGTEVSPATTGISGETCPTACHQLLVGSDLMRSLADHDRAPAGPDWVSMWTDQDKVVVPPTSAKLDGALNFSVQSICPDLTVAHLGMTANPVVVAMVQEELGSATPTRPDSSVCKIRPTSTPSP
ncbi:MAG TPA: hypothetical protein VFE07_05280 [Marmoricola sp.]|nr:hypothetical protein [Marmoricola sp.]